MLNCVGKESKMKNVCSGAVVNLLVEEVLVQNPPIPVIPAAAILAGRDIPPGCSSKPVLHT